MRRFLLLAALVAVLLFVLTAGTGVAGAAILFGNNSVASVQDTNAAWVAEAFSFSAGASGSAQSVSVYVDSGSSASGLAVGLYADNGGHPGSLLAAGSHSAPAAGQWNDVTLDSSPTLSTGTTYWLALLGTGGRLNFRDQNPGTGNCSENSSQSNLASLPSSWTGGATWSSCSLSADVNGTPSSATTAASFSYSPATPVTGESVHFDGTVSTCAVSPCSYSWADDPPSGGSWPLGSGQSIDFTFVQAATKYVTLTVTDGLNRTAIVEHDVVVASAATLTNTSLPTISGTAQQGQTLTASHGSWTGSPTSYAYQWQDCDSSGANCTDIPSATSSSYTLAGADVGHTIRAAVTATNAGGSGSASSTQTAAVVTSGGGTQTCTQTFTPSNIGSSPYPGSNVQSALKSAAAGSVFCFASGSYGEIDLYATNPAGRVTIEPVPGASATGVYFDLNGVSNVTITGFSGSSSSGGMLIQVAGQGNNSNITFSHNAMTSNGVVVQNGSTNANINITENTFVGFASSGEQTRMLVNTTGCPNGVTISHNLLSGGEADGIDIDGGSCDTQILNNEISNIVESNCGGIHCDAIQDNGGGQGTVINGNYIHNSSDCFLLDDGSSGYLIENNVCNTASGGSSYWMQFGGAQNITLNHNTITSTAGAQFGNDHNGNPSSNVTFTNNILYTEPTDNPGQPPSGTFNESYNLCPSGCGGTHETNGTPMFSGGPSPSTWSGFPLTAGSLGHAAGSDGQDIGGLGFAATAGP